MKINNMNTGINFGKRLLAKTAVLGRTGVPVPCNIFKIDADTDKDYFEKVSASEDWKNGEYVDILDEDISYYASDDENISMYAMETENGKCIGIAELSEGKDEKYNLNILETTPVSTNDRRHKNPPYRYIGETMLSFLTNLAIKNGKKSIRTEPADSAADFYTQKCYFKKPKDDDIYHVALKKKSFNKLISQNAEHTKTKMQFLG